MGYTSGSCSQATAMPWKESDTMSERTKFVARLLEGERITDLCREFGISRNTGQRLKRRFAEEGASGLYERSRRPLRSPHRTSQEVAGRVVRLRKKFPTWGPKKLRARLQQLHPEVPWPAASTIGVLLKDAGLVDGRKRRRRAWPTAPSSRQDSRAPNDLWCMDFKGQFRLGDRSYCYPLTVTDHFSRFLLGCDGLESTRSSPAAAALEAVFREFGLPARMRSDNGAPFASTGMAGLTALSVWLLRLGIELERIEPGHPEQNGRHERMHETLKAEATRPAGRTMLQQQEKLDRFQDIYNSERPHEALDMQQPAVVYTPSARRLPDNLEPPTYPLHDDAKTVTQAGVIYLNGKCFYLTTALVSQQVGLRQLEAKTWLVSFLEHDLAYLDLSEDTVTPLTTDFADATA